MGARVMRGSSLYFYFALMGDGIDVVLACVCIQQTLWHELKNVLNRR